MVLSEIFMAAMNAPSPRPTTASGASSTGETAPDVQTQHQFRGAPWPPERVEVLRVKMPSFYDLPGRDTECKPSEWWEPAEVIGVHDERMRALSVKLANGTNWVVLPDYWRLTSNQPRETVATTDREMLELAAKACGLRVKWEPLHACCWIEPGQGLEVRPWDPRDDDGDSRRLQVALPGCVSLTVDDVCARVTWWVKVGDAMDLMHEDVPHHGDKPAASRLAVFRAAVAIGRKMP